MILATIDTDHFTFTALGEDEEDATRALRRGWEAHREQYPDGIPWDEVADYFGVNVVEIVPGVCLRDGDFLASVTR